MIRTKFSPARRSFLHQASSLLLASSFPSLLGLALGNTTGCAPNPVTGEPQLMLVSKEYEIQMDKAQAPHQFSADYGPLQQETVNEYINDTGLKLARLTQRPDMPYSFRGVNAVYLNAYAFPGGSIAITRGMLISLDNEAQLAAVLGHELGHVNARHTAARMSKGLIIQALLTGVSIGLQAQHNRYAPLITEISGIGAGALLAKYSRDDERQADQLGMSYMVKAGYNPRGMVQVMDILRSQAKEDPNLLQLLFASHPMSEERFQTAQKRVQEEYAQYTDRPLFRERYLDHTAPIRKDKPAILAFQKGESLLARKRFLQAEQAIKKGLDLAPDDYTGLLLMAKVLLARKKYQRAEHFAHQAAQVYPQEPQAKSVLAAISLGKRKFYQALEHITAYQTLLPGNPSSTFLKGYCLEGMGQIRAAARAYKTYLQQVQQGPEARYAYSKLVKWGFVR